VCARLPTIAKEKRHPREGRRVVKPYGAPRRSTMASVAYSLPSANHYVASVIEVFVLMPPATAVAANT
jgi:hypothetical protein